MDVSVWTCWKAKHKGSWRWPSQEYFSHFSYPRSVRVFGIYEFKVRVVAGGGWNRKALTLPSLSLSLSLFFLFCQAPLLPSSCFSAARQQDCCRWQIVWCSLWAWCGSLDHSAPLISPTEHAHFFLLFPGHLERFEKLEKQGSTHLSTGLTLSDLLFPILSQMLNKSYNTKHINTNIPQFWIFS